MVKLMDGNWGMKILSILLAVVLWIYVSSQLNPVKEREFKDVPVETRQVSQNMVLVNRPENVSIRVQASQNVLAELTAKSFEVFADLAQAEAGRQVVPLQVKTPPGVKLLNYSPQQAAVTLEPLAEKQVPVKVSFTDQVEKGYRVLAVKTSPDMVILRGPDSDIKNVSSATVEVKLKGRNKSFDEDLPVKVSNGSGRFLDERLVRRTPTVVEVFVSIVPEMPSKPVRITPKIEGAPAEGFQVKTTVVEPETLVITGAQAALAGINELFTQPLDITGAKQDVFANVAVNVPTEVKSSTQTVRVLVKIGPQ